jgi:hypothetical protein
VTWTRAGEGSSHCCGVRTMILYLHDIWTHVMEILPILARLR